MCTVPVNKFITLRPSDMASITRWSLSSSKECSWFLAIIPITNGTGEFTKSSMSRGRRGIKLEAHWKGCMSSSNAQVHDVMISELSPKTRTDLSIKRSFNIHNNASGCIRWSKFATPQCPAIWGGGSGMLNFVTLFNAGSSMSNVWCGWLMMSKSFLGSLTRDWLGDKQTSFWIKCKNLCRSIWFPSKTSCLTSWSWLSALFSTVLSLLCGHDHKVGQYANKMKTWKSDMENCTHSLHINKMLQWTQL